jgi:AcrR family transcriptional regulator
VPRSMATVRSQNAETTRSQVIEAAIRTAHEVGAASFTLDAVVARLPFSKGALLHHFPSKRALLEGVIDHLGQVFVDSVQDLVAKDKEPHLRDARAYLQATMNEVTSPELASASRAVLVACLLEPSLGARWNGYMARLRANDPTDGAEANHALVLRLVADGVWFSEVTQSRLNSTNRRRTLAVLLDPTFGIELARAT